MRKYLWIVLLAVLFAGCSETQNNNAPEDEEKVFVEPPKKVVKTFTPYVIEDSSKIQSFDNGLQLYVVQEGPGNKTQQGENLIVNYHGMLTDGSVFDSSFERGETFSFSLGNDNVIQGWHEGFKHLTYGSKAILIIPAALGYGSRSQPNIPANSTLVFHVELVGSF